MKALITVFAIAIAITGIPSASMAQSPESDKPADKSALVYRSAFSGYRGMTDEKVEWKEANDAVGRIGGWRTYLRESQGPAPAPAQPRAKELAPVEADKRAGGAHKH